MSIRISPNLPANVVEIGNEISQAKIDEINAGTLATQTWVGTQGYLGDATGSINNDGVAYARYNGSWTSLNIMAEPSYGTGLVYGRKNDSPSPSWEAITAGISDAPSNGSTYARKDAGWVVSTGADPKKAIANIAASCFSGNSASTFFFFNGSIALQLSNGSGKFSGSGQYLLGIGYPSGSPTTLALTSSTDANGNLIATMSFSWTSISGSAIAYSDDGGTTWTYSDLTF
jgi:hypothetical protein